jgi:hypothetical protein
VHGSQEPAAFAARGERDPADIDNPATGEGLPLPHDPGTANTIAPSSAHQAEDKR